MINEKMIFNEMISDGLKYKSDMLYSANLFAKNYQPMGMTMDQIRMEMELWARANNLVITVDVNKEIARVLRGRKTFAEFKPVPITRRDINFINTCSPTTGRKRVFFALMVYGKMFEDAIGDFWLPIKVFSEWINFANPSNLYTRHFPWLINNNLLENYSANYVIRGNPPRNGVMVFRIPYLMGASDNTEVVFKIDNNDIMGWYNRIFL